MKVYFFHPKILSVTQYLSSIFQNTFLLRRDFSESYCLLQLKHIEKVLLSSITFGAPLLWA